MAAEEDREDAAAGGKYSIDASVRSAKKAARPVKLTVAAPERVPKDRTKKKKGAKNAFERELGINGRAEREAAGEKEPRPGPRERKMLGGSAGKGKTSMGPKSKRANKSSTRS